MLYLEMLMNTEIDNNVIELFRKPADIATRQHTMS